MRRFLAGMGLTVLAVAVCLTAGVSAAGAAASKRDAALTKGVRGALAHADVSGAIVGVWQRGRRPYLRAFGTRDPATNEPMATNLHMRIGSVTKTFTITAILQLVDQGKLSLDDKIGKYIPGVTGGDQITLRQLASMTSGIPSYTFDPRFDEDLVSDPHREFTPQQLLGYVAGQPLMFAPGTSFAYSNTNTILLGLVVEQVSGQSLPDYLRQHILQPLGMSRTSFPLTSDMPAPFAHGFTQLSPSSPVTDATNYNPSWTWAAGQLVSDAHDLRIWARRLISGRGLLSPATQRERLASVAGPGDPIAYGIGLFNVQGWLGHNGSLPGYQTLTLRRPKARATIVALLTSDIEVGGRAPSTLVGQAITKVITPKHVYTLPAAPTAEPE
ncbi:serine hydrolase domain-containing protein [Capillimicrobium parvum]|uniref:D-alanyl-D-alanine carboxypeptidase n=1 Tax=Capillimicrobium parvum TaxID=2884022 RepID=A0A9E6XRZ3_9ACTN|nr:serine hydrolase domain-containing protein [Capillimicrobium parvum]UGS33755.1 D-alanyl-D-alanine carboxypeptidase [Capillimicrobium parvum]